MYIESLHYKNIGPLSDLNIQFRKNEKGVPIPLVVVGKMEVENPFCYQILLMRFMNLQIKHMIMQRKRLVRDINFIK